MNQVQLEGTKRCRLEAVPGRSVASPDGGATTSTETAGPSIDPEPEDSSSSQSESQSSSEKPDLENPESSGDEWTPAMERNNLPTQQHRLRNIFDQFG